jgi:hypothetical protein
MKKIVMILTPDRPVSPVRQFRPAPRHQQEAAALQGLVWTNTYTTFYTLKVTQVLYNRVLDFSCRYKLKSMLVPKPVLTQNYPN